MATFSDSFEAAFPDYNTPGVPASGPAKPVKSIIREIGETLDRAVGPPVLLRSTGSAASDATYNAALIQERLDSGGAHIFPADETEFYCDPLEITDKAVEFVALPLSSGSISLRPVLQLPPNATDHLITMSGDTAARLTMRGMDIRGNRDNQTLDLCGIKVLAAASETREAVRLYDTYVRFFSDDGVNIGANRHNWGIYEGSFVGQCDGYGIKSLQCEDIYLLDSKINETGKTGFWCDGASGQAVGNIRLNNVDISRTGMLAPSEGGSPNTTGRGDYSGVFLGGYVTDSKMEFLDVLGCYRHGIEIGTSGLSSTRVAHIIENVRFNSNSRSANGIYSDFYTRGGEATLVGCRHVPYETAPPSLPKYLVELASDYGADNRINVIGSQWSAPIPSPAFAGSYITGRASDNAKVNWIDKNFLLMAADCYLRAAGGSSSDLFWNVSGSGGQDQFRSSRAGNMLWGNGSLAPDVSLFRRDADQLKTDDKFLAALGFGSGAGSSATTLGAVIRKEPLYDAAGALLGYLAVYDNIT